MTPRDRSIVSALADWLRAHARDLPWRTGSAPTPSGRDPYHALVSEMMLQQTQVSRVLEKYPAFLQRFPTLADLARAPEPEVLACWSGLGYYRRARLLHAAARAAMDAHSGTLPDSPEALETLPGIGRYTAGAIASLVHHRVTPIVDGNVARVLLRVEGRPAEHGSKGAMAWSWERADALAQAAGPATVAAFNEGLMELGATICTPRSPDCPSCPLLPHCRARAQGRQEEIPSPKQRAERRTLWSASVLLRDGHGRTLVVRRPERGLWAGLWAPPSIEREDRAARPAEVRAGLGCSSLRRVGAFTHTTTHREVRFTVFAGRAEMEPAGGPEGTRWVGGEELNGLGLSSAHRRVLEMG